MVLNIITILIGLEQLYDNIFLHQLRLFLQNPINKINIEKIISILKITDETNNINQSDDFLIHQIKNIIFENYDTLSIFKILMLSGLNDFFIKNLSKSLVSYPNLNWNDAFSKGQLYSKLWLIDEVKKLNLHLGNVFVCAGWLGTLPALIFRDGNIKYNYFRSFDIDVTCADAADTLNRNPYVVDGWKFKASTSNIFDIDYNNYTYETKKKDGSLQLMNESPDTIINTSCDHIFPFKRWWDLIPDGKLVILQNNDSKIDADHINNINSLDEMKKQAPMKEILYEGILRLPDYNRYMLIGIK